MNPAIELIKLKAALIENDHARFMSEQEALELMSHEFPAISNRPEITIYASMKALAGLTRQLAQRGNIKEVKRCFAVAEKMIREGNGIVKNAVRNSYIFSLSSLLGFSTPLSEKVRAALGGPLRKEFYEQVNASGL